MKLRSVSADDWEIWRDVRLRALADASESFGSTLAEWQSAGEDRWRQRLSAVPFNVVAFVRDEPLGQASATGLDPEASVELISMWVAQSARGTGVADALVAAVMRYAEQVTASAVRLSVQRHNQRAIGLYKRAGFVVSDEPVDELDAIAMRYVLGTQ